MFDCVTTSWSSIPR